MPQDAPNNERTLARGSAPILRFTVDADSVPAGDPVSGWTTKYTIRTTPDEAAYALQASGSWNAATSTIDVSITRAQMLTLAAGAYVGALFRTNAGSEDKLSGDDITVEECIYDGP